MSSRILFPPSERGPSAPVPSIDAMICTGRDQPHLAQLRTPRGRFNARKLPNLQHLLRLRRRYRSGHGHGHRPPRRHAHALLTGRQGRRAGGHGAGARRGAARESLRRRRVSAAGAVRLLYAVRRADGVRRRSSGPCPRRRRLRTAGPTRVLSWREHRPAALRRPAGASSDELDIFLS